MESAATHVDFPDDIVVEILRKLPILSVFKCRCVSKRWLWLISDASFTSRYVIQSPAPFIFLFQMNKLKDTLSFLWRDKTLTKMSPSTLPSPRFSGLRIIATAHDLILYRSDQVLPGYYVANPFTSQCVRVPLQLRRQIPWCPEPALIPHVRDGVAAGYTVVRAFREGDERPTLLEVFSSESGEWRFLRPRNVDIDLASLDSRAAVVFGEKAHWLSRRAGSLSLVAYDPRSGEAREIPTPCEECCVNGMSAVVGACGGELYCFQMRGIALEMDNRLPRWRLWVMSDYDKGEWRAVRAGKKRAMEGLVGDMLSSSYSPLHPVGMHPTRKDVLVYFWYEGYILTFDTNRGCFEDNIVLFSPATSTSEIFPLLTPLCSTRLSHNNTVAV